MITIQLLRPLNYMFIKDDSKHRIDIYVPLALSGITLVVIYGLASGVKLVDKDTGLLNNLTLFLAVLPGFYITALAAVATFNRPEMDQLLPYPAPTLEVFANGNKTKIELTRRRMLSLLFGYLSFLSIILFLLSIAAIALSGKVLFIQKISVSEPILLFCYLMMFWNMVSVTMFGLYQLSDRIHQVG